MWLTESTVVAFKTANKMPAYKLMYFEAKGRAEVFRLAFTIAEQMFEDKRFSIEEWYTVKPSTYTFLFSQVKLMQIILMTLLRRYNTVKRENLVHTFLAQTQVLIHRRK